MLDLRAAREEPIRVGLVGAGLFGTKLADPAVLSDLAAGRGVPVEEVRSVLADDGAETSLREAFDAARRRGRRPARAAAPAGRGLRGTGPAGPFPS